MRITLFEPITSGRTARSRTGTRRLGFLATIAVRSSLRKNKVHYRSRKQYIRNSTGTRASGCCTYIALHPISMYFLLHSENFRPGWSTCYGEPVGRGTVLAGIRVPVVQFSSPWVHMEYLVGNVSALQKYIGTLNPKGGFCPLHSARKARRRSRPRDSA